MADQSKSPDQREEEQKPPTLPLDANVLSQIQKLAPSQADLAALAAEDEKERQTIIDALQGATPQSNDAKAKTPTTSLAPSRHVPKPQDEYKFWNTQPVSRFGTILGALRCISTRLTGRV